MSTQVSRMRRILEALTHPSLCTCNLAQIRCGVYNSSFSIKPKKNQVNICIEICSFAIKPQKLSEHIFNLFISGWMGLVEALTTRLAQCDKPNLWLRCGRSKSGYLRKISAELNKFTPAPNLVSGVPYFFQPPFIFIIILLLNIEVKIQ